MHADTTSDEQPGGRSDEGPDEASDEAPDEVFDEAPDEVSDEAPDDDTPAVAAGGDVPAAEPSAAPPGLPAADRIERDFDAFLEKFKRETGQR